MSGRLPAQINPIRLAEEGVRLVGELPGHELGRLHEAPQTDMAPVLVDLTFERTLHGVRMLRGSLRTTVETTCQRCLEPFRLALVAKPVLALLTPTESPDGLPEEAETMVVEGPVSLRDLVEDELLLVMPMIPMHAEGECTAPVAFEESEAKVSGTDHGRPNPFAVLRERKTKD